VSVADRWRQFAKNEAAGRSPLYEEIARGVARDRDLIAFLDRLSHAEQQPNLLLASVRYLGGTGSGFTDFRTFVLDHRDEVLNLLHTRRTQTNEVGRCAVLFPALAELSGPLALLEVGASAGLCLFPDRFGYRYGSRAAGDPSSLVQLPCEVQGPFPMPSQLPEVVWRRGIDLNPLDVTKDDDMRWLEACVWPDQSHRPDRLRAATEVARRDPPAVAKGNLLDIAAEIAAEAPQGATLVIFHCAVLAYVSPDDRRRFAERVAQMPAIWLSNEGIGVLKFDAGAGLPIREDKGLSFVLARDGLPVALADPHGARLRWL
jgi:hypothetical protein